MRNMRCDLFTVVVTKRDHWKKMYKGSENADREKSVENTRRVLPKIEQQLRRVDYALSRAEDTPEGSWICLSHRNLILAEDKRCSMFLQFLAHAQTFGRGVPPGGKRFGAVSQPSTPCARVL